MARYSEVGCNVEDGVCRVTVGPCHGFRANAMSMVPNLALDSHNILAGYIDNVASLTHLKRIARLNRR